MSKEWVANFREKTALKGDVDREMHLMRKSFAQYADASLGDNFFGFEGSSAGDTRRNLCRSLSVLMQSFRADTEHDEAMSVERINSYSLMRDVHRAHLFISWVINMGLLSTRRSYDSLHKPLIETVAIAAGKSIEDDAPETNRALTLAYGNLLLISAHPKLNTGLPGSISGVDEYMSHLRDVWQAAGQYQDQHDNQSILGGHLNAQIKKVSEYGLWGRFPKFEGVSAHEYIYTLIGPHRG